MPKSKSVPWVKCTNNIYRRGSKYYFVKQVNKKRQFIRLDDAKTLGEAVDKGIHLLSHPTVTGQCLSDEVKRFVDYKVKSGEWRQTSAKSHQYTLDGFMSYIGQERSINTIRAGELQTWYNEQHGLWSVATLQTKWAVVCSLFQWAKKVARIILANPCENVKMVPYEKKVRKKFCEFEQRDILEKAALAVGRDDLIFTVLLGFCAGMRRREIDHARPEWFNLERRVIYIMNLDKRSAAKLDLDPFKTKNGKERVIPMATPLFDYLSKFESLPGAYLIHPEKRHAGKSRYRYDMRRPFGDLVKSKGMPWVGFHTMRHTFASLLASSGKVTIHEIANWLGDSVRETEQTYAHLIPNFDRMNSALYQIQEPVSSPSATAQKPSAAPPDVIQ